MCGKQKNDPFNYIHVFILGSVNILSYMAKEI